MNRREFLKSLAAAGGLASLSIEGLASVLNTVALPAQSSLCSADHLTFYANPAGMLSTRPGLEGVNYLVTRAQLLELPPTPNDLAGLRTYLSDHPEAAHAVAEEFGYWMTGEEGFRRITGRNLTRVRDFINDWSAGDPTEPEYVFGALIGTTGRADALYWFLGRMGLAVSAGVTFNDVRIPASPDRGAVLFVPMAEANRRCETHHIKVRFVAADC